MTAETTATAPAAQKPIEIGAEVFVATILAAKTKGCTVIILDDIGTAPNSKVPPERIKLPPSWKLETSPGNFQYGYILEKGTRAAARALIRALRKAGFRAHLVRTRELVQ